MSCGNRSTRWAKENDHGPLRYDCSAVETVKGNPFLAKSERGETSQVDSGFRPRDAKRLHAHLPVIDRRKTRRVLYSIRDYRTGRLDGAEELGMTVRGRPDTRDRRRPLRCRCTVIDDGHDSRWPTKPTAREFFRSCSPTRAATLRTKESGSRRSPRAYRTTAKSETSKSKSPKSTGSIWTVSNT